jgi:hypothetical protein
LEEIGGMIPFDVIGPEAVGGKKKNVFWGAFTGAVGGFRGPGLKGDQGGGRKDKICGHGGQTRPGVS